MRTPRIYHEGQLTAGGRVTLSETAGNHLVRVLRATVDAPVILFNGDGQDYAGRIAAIGRRGVSVELTTASAGARESPARITLLQGICRGQKMDLLIQKATELGVSAIVPILCDRTVVRLAEQRLERRLAHWQAVAVSACEQSGRATLPDVAAPTSLAEALAGLPAAQHRLLLDPAGEPLAAQFGDSAGPRSVALLIGPEGGLTAAERADAGRSGFVPIRLGPRVLRTETAPLAALSILQYLWGDLGPAAD